MFTVEADLSVRPEGVLTGTTRLTTLEGEGASECGESESDSECGESGESETETESVFLMGEEGLDTSTMTGILSVSSGSWTGKVVSMASKSTNPLKKASMTGQSIAGNLAARWARRAALVVKGRAVAARKRRNLVSKSI